MRWHGEALRVGLGVSLGARIEHVLELMERRKAFMKRLVDITEHMWGNPSDLDCMSDAMVGLADMCATPQKLVDAGGLPDGMSVDFENVWGRFSQAALMALGRSAVEALQKAMDDAGLCNMALVIAKSTKGEYTFESKDYQSMKVKEWKKLRSNETMSDVLDIALDLVKTLGIMTPRLDLMVTSAASVT